TRPLQGVRGLVPAVSAASGRSRLAVLAAVARTARDSAPMAATCEVAVGAAQRLGLGGTVADSLGQVLATWDGSGHPDTAGSQIPIATRIAQAAGVAVLFALWSGPADAVAEVRRR